MGSMAIVFIVRYGQPLSAKKQESQIKGKKENLIWESMKNFDVISAWDY
jgi:hypothetical protein